MPLSKARMRERKRQDRSVKPKSNLTRDLPVKPNQLDPNVRPINTEFEKAEKLTILRQIISDPPQSKIRLLKEESNGIIPYVRGRKYKPGTELILPNGETIIAPEIDADGNPIYT